MSPRTIRRAIVAAGAVIALLLLPAKPAPAHPLGNFTINRYAGLLVTPQSVEVDYILDLAELPTFQERQVNEAPAENRCADLADGLTVTVDGVERPLSTDSAAITLPDGEAGLSTTRIECRFRAGIDVTADDPVTIGYEDANYPSRLGWKEITAVGDGTELTTDLPAASITDRLASYPAEGTRPDLTATTLDAVAGAGGRGSAPGDRVGTGDGGEVATTLDRPDSSPGSCSARSVSR